jgi:CubicO group peptidase (beta-lactamase class C family)
MMIILGKKKFQGFVHDPAAALIGGVGGHAGLFSNTNDMAKYAQMLLNNGTYGGEMYFSKNTVNQFTRKSSSSNRRGLGFDKPETTPGKSYSNWQIRISIYFWTYRFSLAHAFGLTLSII